MKENPIEKFRRKHIIMILDEAQNEKPNFDLYNKSQNKIFMKLFKDMKKNRSKVLGKTN